MSNYTRMLLLCVSTIFTDFLLSGLGYKYFIAQLDVSTNAKIGLLVVLFFVITLVVVAIFGFISAKLFPTYFDNIGRQEPISGTLTRSNGLPSGYRIVYSGAQNVPTINLSEGMYIVNFGNGKIILTRTGVSTFKQGNLDFSIYVPRNVPN